jgi:rubredoxin
MRLWECIVCGWVYDEAKGWLDDGIAPGTRWEDIPGDWMCPDCGVGKEDFMMVDAGPSPSAREDSQDEAGQCR